MPRFTLATASNTLIAAVSSESGHNSDRDSAREPPTFQGRCCRAISATPVIFNSKKTPNYDYTISTRAR
ncbi:hypothetical protein [Candidatus Magnetominusculus dajiuhuensis]|uniref:hypothetical protein n=1 Tax=Candidatus Magnetominusculus dajiuhuensis TaxID=3137712 RepID=UPI003B432B01